MKRAWCCLWLALSAAAPASSSTRQEQSTTERANPLSSGAVSGFQLATIQRAGNGLRAISGHSNWLAAAGEEITFVDFDELPDGQKINGTGALLPWGIADTTGFSVNVDPPGIVDQYVTASSSLTFPMFVPGTLPSEPNFLSNDPTFPGGAAATGQIEITFVELRCAAGFYVADQTPLDGFLVEAFDGNHSLGQEEFPPRALPDSFAGFVSSLPFDRLVIRAKHLQDSWGLDNLEHAGSSLGTSYCTSNPNSTGFVARLIAAGNPSIAANDVTLAALPVPNQFGIFYFGSSETFNAFGNGYMCVSGSLTRILPPTLAHDHIAIRSLDLQGLGIVPGTLKFQYWMRDPAGGGALFNTSSACSIQFFP